MVVMVASEVRFRLGGVILGLVGSVGRDMRWPADEMGVMWLTGDQWVFESEINGDRL